MSTHVAYIVMTVIMFGAIHMGRADSVVESGGTNTHPLMPGIRSDEIGVTDWSRTLHDKQLTGFSPLTLGMAEAPRVWQTIDVGGTATWVKSIVLNDDTEALLVNDGRLRLIDPSNGSTQWSSDAVGTLVFFGNLRGDGKDCVLLSHANTLTLLDGATGTTVWQRDYDPPHVHLRVQVADVLPDQPGMEAAVWTQYGEDGWLLNFPPDDDPVEVWRTTVITNDEWPVRADHGCDIKFDLRDPDRPVIWNVRHHRCQSFDARTGEELGRLIYELDGGIRRNYGPWDFARSSDGMQYIVVASEMVQTHVHSIRLHPDGTPELAWERYYGEVYVVPGVTVVYLGVADVDGDGADELVYNARDPENDFRSFFRVRDAATGEVKYEFADSWCSGMAEGVGPEGTTVMYIHPAPDGATPEQGPMKLVSFTGGKIDTLRSFDHARPWGVLTAPTADGNDLFVDVSARECTVLRLDGSDMSEVSRVEAASGFEDAVLGSVQHGSDPLYVTSTGRIRSWDNTNDSAFDLSGGPASTLSAADLNGDGTAELIAHIPGDRFAVWSLKDGAPAKQFAGSFLGTYPRYSPLLYDLDADGDLELIVPDAAPTGELCVRTYHANGETMWETVLPHSRTDDEGKVVAWNAGDFIDVRDATAADDATVADGEAHAGLAITVYSKRRTMEGTFLLDGATGEVQWYRDLYYDGNNIRGYRPVGIPGVFDWDRDGVEEIAWDMYSYMAFLRGDGEFAAIFGGPNVNGTDPVPAIMLYNSFSPIYRTADAEQPHWLVTGGHGRFGFVGPDPREGIWWEDEGYDTPDRIGFIDVDGDGVMEVGYALKNSAEFRCRDLWTGEMKWTLELPDHVSGPVITADVDGDGKGEFLVDRWCIGTDDSGNGVVKWESPVPLGWAIIADFDGDGIGEIACAGRGKLYVLKAGE
jgi:outer membrane protein assembly factor BamB